MGDFDIDGARKAGYSDDEILREMAPKGFDVDGAISAGYSAAEIISELSPKKDVPVSVPMAENSAYNRAQKLKNTTVPELIMGSAPGRFVQGMADYPMGLAQAILQPPKYSQSTSGPDLGINPANGVTPVRDVATAGHEALTNVLRQGDQMRSAGREAYGSEGMDLARMGGNVSAGIGSTKNIPIAAALKGKVQQGAVLGEAFGGMAPTTSNDPNRERMINTLAGTAGGAVLPPVIAGAAATGRGIGNVAKTTARTARNVADPWFPGGYDRARDRMMRELIGNENLPKAQQSLQGPLDPNLMGGEAAARSGLTELPALQEVAKKVKPTDYYQKLGQQRAQRLGELDKVGGTADDLANATKTRKANADQNYADAYNRSVEGDKEITTLLKKINDFLPSTLKSAGRLARVNGIKMKNNKIDNADFTKYGHYLKIALDKAMARTGSKALDNTEKKAAKDLQKEMVSWLKTKNSAYENARETYAADSIPVNQGQIGQALKDALSSPLGAKETASTFARAMDDAPRTIKNATGSTRFNKLGEILSPEGERAANRVLGRLENEAASQEMSKLGRMRVQEILGEIGKEHPPTMLHRGMMLLNAVLSKAGSSRQGKVMNEIADAVISGPEALRKIMPDMTTEQAVQLRSYLQGLPSMQPISRTTSGILAQQGVQ